MTSLNPLALCFARCALHHEMALVTRGSVDYEVKLLAIPSEEKTPTFDWDDVEVSHCCGETKSSQKK